MSVREFQLPDGSAWRAWAVRPDQVAGERRLRERRVTPAESLADPPALEQRRAADRRRPGPRRSRAAPATLLPRAWQAGWLVFERLATPDGSAPDEMEHETHRLTPIPACWDRCSGPDLAAHLAEATASTQRRARAKGPA